MLNKRAQVGSIIAFVAIAVGILFLAPFILKSVVTPLSAFSTAVRPLSNASADAVDYGVSKFNGFWDSVIIFALFMNILILFITSFLVDIHPSLVIVYIIGVVCLFFFVPNYLQTVNNIYTSSAFSTEISNLPMANWILSNFTAILLGVVAITGIIMFSKFAFGQGSSSKGVGAYAK